jgi:hypothetical protein
MSEVLIKWRIALETLECIKKISEKDQARILFDTIQSQKRYVIKELEGLKKNE